MPGVVVAASGADILAVTPARVWVYSTANATWTPGPALLRGGYSVAAAVVLPDGRLVLLRSDVIETDIEKDCASAKPLLAVEVLDATRTTWSEGPSIPSRISFSAAADPSGTIHLIGGADRTMDCEGSSVTDNLSRVRSLTLSAP